MQIPIPFKKYILFFVVCTLVFTSCKKDDNPDTDDDPLSFTGEVEFIKTFGGSDIDEAVGIVQANDGNYIIIGSTQSNDGDIVGKAGNDNDYWLLKLDPNGNIIFNRTYGGSNDDRATGIKKTADGGFIISGYSRSSDGDVNGNEGFHDFWLVKVNSNGDMQWNKNFGFSGSDQALKVFETSQGNYFATGFLDVTASGGDGDDFNENNGDGDNTRNQQHGVGEYWGIMMDSNGNKLWRRYFGGTNNDRSYDALETADGGILMVGASESIDFDKEDPKGSYDYWAVRLTVNGEKLWTKSFGGSEIDTGYALTTTTDGNYLMVGDSRSMDGDISSPKGNADAWAVKFNDNGNLIWQKSYGGAEFDSAKGITNLQNGKYAITGNTRSTAANISNQGGNDAWVFVIDENGNEEFNFTAGGSGLDFADGVVQTSDNKLIFVGNTESSDGNITTNKGLKDLMVIKLK